MTWDGADGTLVTCWFWVCPAVCTARGSKAKQNKTCWDGPTCPLGSVRVLYDTPFPSLCAETCSAHTSSWIWASQMALMVKNPLANAGDIRDVGSIPEKVPWRRKWQPTPVFLPGESHGQRSLAGYHPWGHKESDRTEWWSICASRICSHFPSGVWRQALRNFHFQ